VQLAGRADQPEGTVRSYTNRLLRGHWTPLRRKWRYSLSSQYRQAIAHVTIGHMPRSSALVTFQFFLASCISYGEDCQGWISDRDGNFFCHHPGAQNDPEARPASYTRVCSESWFYSPIPDDEQSPETQWVCLMGVFMSSAQENKTFHCRNCNGTILIFQLSSCLWGRNKEPIEFYGTISSCVVWEILWAPRSEQLR
jgi:hypothetical protein